MKILENMRESTLIRTLETVYPNVDVEASLCSGTFYLKDDKACQDGISKNVCEKDCNREVLRINTTGHLVSVRWEPFIAGKVQACDYIIFNADGDLHRFAFCDLSCSLSRYVDNRNGKIGKREKVYNQLKSSWLFIKDEENKALMLQIMTFRHKCGIFGWREKKISIASSAGSSMSAFIATPASTAGITCYRQYLFGEVFDFIQVKYPAVFQWDAD